MSKRSAASSFTLDEQPASAAKKVRSGFTGGRASVEEQRRIGGEADRCPIYDLYLFHFALEDEYAKRVYDECYKGVRMCGECKQELATIVKRYLEEHRRKRDSLMKDAEELLTSSRRRRSGLRRLPRASCFLLPCGPQPPPLFLCGSFGAALALMLLELAVLVKRYLEEHQKRRESLMKDAEELLEKSRKTLDSIAR